MEKKMICRCEEIEEPLSGNHPSVMDFWESLSLGQKFDILRNDFDEVEAFKYAKLHFYELPNKITSYLMNKGRRELSGKSQATGKYRVTRGIFKDHVFNGHEVVINRERRIWDDDSVGNSYPIENTEKISGGLSGKIVNEELAKTSPCNKVESVRYFKKGIAGSLNKEQIRDYCFEKE